MAGRLNKCVAKAGATAYQDHEDPTMFHYVPNRIDPIMGETLLDFECKYYGIGGKPYYKAVDGATFNVSGGVVSGRAVPDITSDQRAALIAEIGKVMKIDDAYLVPLEIEKANLQPVFAGVVAAQGRDSSSVFPSSFKYGSSFNFNVASGNSLFPQLVAVSNPGQESEVSSFIAANFSGVAKLYGDPWKARLTADLSQVWSYVRSKGDTGVSAGWFNFGAAWDSVAQELKKKNIIKMEFIEGTGGEEFGRNMLEATRQVFDAINAQITAGEGMFKFDPNPTPQEPPKHEGSWGSSLLPYSLSVNLSFSSNTFDQSILFDQEVSFTGIRDIPMMSSMNLSAVCDSKNKGMFLDVQNSENRCVDKPMMDGWDKRMSAEQKAKSAKIEEYEKWFVAKTITFTEYQGLLALLNVRTLTEATDRAGRPLSVAEASAAFDREAAQRILKREVAREAVNA